MQHVNANPALPVLFSETEMAEVGSAALRFCVVSLHISIMQSTVETVR